MIANKEYDKLPKKIKYNDEIYEWGTQIERYDYVAQSDESKNCYKVSLRWKIVKKLNDEVEII